MPLDQDKIEPLILSQDSVRNLGTWIQVRFFLLYTHRLLPWHSTKTSFYSGSAGLNIYIDA